MKIRYTQSLLLLALTTLLSIATAEVEIPKGDTFLVERWDRMFELHTTPGRGDSVILDRFTNEDDAKVQRGWRIETRKRSNPSWAVELETYNAIPASKGEVGLIRFYARTLETGNESGSGQLQIAVRENSDNYHSLLEANIPIPTEWALFELPFAIDKDFDLRSLSFSFRFGFNNQIIEFGNLEIVNLGDEVDFEDIPKKTWSYNGREKDAQWRKDAFARIEQLRKSNIVIKVQNKEGNSINNATVSIEQTRSAFEWGVALHYPRLTNDTPDNLIYRKYVLELFNAASNENDLKWPVWEGDWADRGNYSHEYTYAAFDWLTERKFPIRGHVLVWPGWNNLPKSITDLKDTDRQDDIPGLVIEHIKLMADKTNDFVEEWDLINEPYSNHDLMDIFGKEIMIDWFKAAHEAMPGKPLYFNDYSNHDITADPKHVAHYLETTRFLIDGGAPVDGLGLQSHFFGTPSEPENILKTFDLYWDEFQLPIRITEWDFNTDDQKLQADFTRDFLILCYSHEAVVGVQHWGFWESAHWLPLAAMFEADWTPKLNYYMYKEWVLNKWMTQLEGSTNSTGTFAGRGFHGDYTVTINHNGNTVKKSLTLSKETPTGTLTFELN